MERLKSMLPAIRARFTEPSTWTAIGGILMAFGINTETPLWQAITYIGMGVAFLLGVVMPEKKADSQ